MQTSITRGRRGRRRTLTEDEILDAALTLLDEGGPNAATGRGIAARVGVAPNAVYTYFPDKAAVVAALVDRLLGEVDHNVFADRSQPWRLRVESLAVELRQRLTAHPGAVPLMGILRVLALIPILSGLIWFAAVVFGLGALTVTIRRTRSTSQPIPAPA